MHGLSLVRCDRVRTPPLDRATMTTPTMQEDRLRLTPREEGSVRLEDGRQLAFAEWGEATGQPVLLMHPTPGCRIYCPDNYRVERTSADLGARVITIDRPGFGRSDLHPGRTLRGWADDVVQLLDALALDSVAVVGISGGGPHAIAVGIGAPERVRRLGLVCSLAPLREVMWERLQPEHRVLLELAADDPFRSLAAMRDRVAWLTLPLEEIASPRAFPGVESWIVDDPHARAVLMAELDEARRQGIDGAAWDRICLDTPWGFSAADLATDTVVWSGDRDDAIGPEHFAYLRATIPAARSVVWEGDGHRTLARGDRWGEVLETLVA